MFDDEVLIVVKFVDSVKDDYLEMRWLKVLYKRL